MIIFKNNKYRIDMLEEDERNGDWNHVVLTLSGKGYAAVGMMNWDNGIAEENGSCELTEL